MATDQQTADFITGQMDGKGNCRSRKMFGEYAVYCHDKVVALICDATLYLKDTAAGATLLPNAAKGHPYPGGKLALVVEEELWEDRELMTKLAEETAAVLPAKKK